METKLKASSLFITIIFFSTCTFTNIATSFISGEWTLKYIFSSGEGYSSTVLHDASGKLSIGKNSEYSLELTSPDIKRNDSGKIVITKLQWFIWFYGEADLISNNSQIEKIKFSFRDKKIVLMINNYELVFVK